jgi:hypothetical protein
LIRTTTGRDLTPLGQQALRTAEQLDRALHELRTRGRRCSTRRCRAPLDAGPPGQGPGRGHPCANVLIVPDGE